MKETAKDAIIILFLVILAAVILSPFLFYGRIFLDADVTTYYYPVFDFYSRALKSGESFLWNPLLYSGFPTYVSQTGGFFDPLNRLLFKHLPAINAYHLRLLIDFSLIFTLSYLAGRALGLSRLASSLIGPSYFSSLNWVYSSNVMVANTLFLLPLLVLVFKKQLAGGWRRVVWSLGGGLGLGWALISGNVQIVIYGLFLFGFFCLFYFLWLEPKKDFHSFFKFFIPLLTVVIIGILFALPQILPSFKFIPLTSRAGGVDLTEAYLKGVGWGDFFNFLFPDNLYFPYLAPGRKPLHVGALWFFLAIAGFALKKKNKLITILAALFGFSLLASLAGSPLFYILQKLPVLVYFRNPYKWMYAGSFFLALLGAFGFDLLGKQTGERLKRIFKPVTVFIGGITFFILALNFLGVNFWSRAAGWLDLIFSRILYGHFGFSKGPAHYQDAIRRGIMAWREFTSFSDIYFLVSFLSLLIAVGLILAFLYRRLSWQKFQIFSLAAVLIAFLGTSFGQFSNNIAKELVLRSHQRLVEKFITKADLNLYRIYTFSVDQGFVERVPPKFKFTLEEYRAFTELRFAAGKPNLNFLAKVSSVEGYDPLIPRDFLTVLGIMGSTDSVEEETGRLTAEKKINRLLKNLDVLGMMAGKYIISGVKLASPDLRFLGEQAVSRFSIPLYIYENSKSLPRFYWAKEFKEAPGKSLADLVQEGKNDFQRVTYLDCAGCFRPFQDSGRSLEMVSAKNGFFEFQTMAEKKQWLMVSESYLPGWTAEIDGVPAKIIRANGIYMAIEVPNGYHRLIFKFSGL